MRKSFVWIGSRKKKIWAWSMHVCGIAVTGCMLSTQPDLGAAGGTYVLDAVDGAAIPAAIEAGSCPHEIFSGDLQLSEGVNGERPFYALLVSVRLRCDPDRLLPINERRFVEDAGDWTINDGKVEFQSSNGFGIFRVPIETGAAGIDPVAILELKFGSRTFRFRRVGF